MDNFIDKNSSPETSPESKEGTAPNLDSLLLPSSLAENTRTQQSPLPTHGVAIIKDETTNLTRSNNAHEVVLITLHGANANGAHPMHEWIRNVAEASLPTDCSLRHLTVEYDFRKDPQESGQAIARILPAIKPDSQVLIVGHSQGSYVGYFAAKELQKTHPTTLAMLDRPILSGFSQTMIDVGNATFGLLPGLKEAVRLNQGSGISRGQDQLAGQSPPYDLRLHNHDPWENENADPATRQDDFAAIANTVKDAIQVVTTTDE